MKLNGKETNESGRNMVTERRITSHNTMGTTGTVLTFIILAVLISCMLFIYYREKRMRELYESIKEELTTVELTTEVLFEAESVDDNPKEQAILLDQSPMACFRNNPLNAHRLLPHTILRCSGLKKTGPR